MALWSIQLLTKNEYQEYFLGAQGGWCVGLSWLSLEFFFFSEKYRCCSRPFSVREEACNPLFNLTCSTSSEKLDRRMCQNAVQNSSHCACSLNSSLNRRLSTATSCSVWRPRSFVLRSYRFRLPGASCVLISQHCLSFRLNIATELPIIPGCKLSSLQSSVMSSRQALETEDDFSSPRYIKKKRVGNKFCSQLLLLLLQWSDWYSPLECRQRVTGAVWRLGPNIANHLS